MKNIMKCSGQWMPMLMTMMMVQFWLPFVKCVYNVYLCLPLPLSVSHYYLWIPLPTTTTIIIIIIIFFFSYISNIVIIIIIYYTCLSCGIVGKWVTEQHLYILNGIYEYEYYVPFCEWEQLAECMNGSD